MGTHGGRADHRIEAAAIATARQQTDALRQNSRSRSMCAPAKPTTAVSPTSLMIAGTAARDHFRGRFSQKCRVPSLRTNFGSDSVPLLWGI
jgi:hypothetical protein